MENERVAAGQVTLRDYDYEYDDDYDYDIQRRRAASPGRSIWKLQRRR
jgi:hypothetical protein